MQIAPAFSAPPPARPLAAELQATAPVSLLPEDVQGGMRFADRTGSSPAPSGAWTSPGVLRVENFGTPKYADHVNVSWPFRQTAKRGDLILVRFFARAEYAR